MATTEKLTAGDSLNFADPKDNVGRDDIACVQCGRKVGKNAWWVEVINGGDIRLQDGTEHDIANDRGYMGCWAVGSECAKTFDPRVLFKRNS
jgi:hypothetical protein